MLTRLALRLAVLAIFLPGPAAAYVNPILGPINDPDCIRMDGLFRLIEPEGGKAGGYFNYRTSSDLVHWSDPVRILQQPPGVQLWQGSFYRDINGQLYLYAAVVDANRGKTVHVAAADSFTGPFHDLGVVAQNGIDPYPLRDPSGQLWLYYKNTLPDQQSIWVQPMADPSRPGPDPAREILHPEPGTFEDNGYVSVEGPTVIHRGGYYFLLYTGGPYDQKTYAVGYAVSRHPDGPFVRGPNNPILSISRNPNVYSPGVPTVVRDGAGQSWLVYRQRLFGALKAARMLTIDRLDDSGADLGLLNAYPTNGEARPDPVPLR